VGNIGCIHIRAMADVRLWQDIRATNGTRAAGNWRLATLFQPVRKLGLARASHDREITVMSPSAN
jgi:hypothetical protein